MRIFGGPLGQIKLVNHCPKTTVCIQTGLNWNLNDTDLSTDSTLSQCTLNIANIQKYLNIILDSWTSFTNNQIYTNLLPGT